MSSLKGVCIRLVLITIGALLISGCAGNPGDQLNVGLISTSGGCRTIIRELRKFERRGIPYKADAASRGAKLSPKTRAEVRRYNSLLDTYMGNQCHA